MKIIGISGKKGSGKDTAAKIICETLADITIERMAFADALKDEVCDILYVTRMELEEIKPLVRPFLQWWGTEWRRRQDENYWIEKLRLKIKQSQAQVVIVTDLRFRNEYASLAENEGFTSIRVDRPDTWPASDSHPSEVELDNQKFNYTLTNNSTLDQFQLDVARFTNRVLTQKLGLAIRGEP